MISFKSASTVKTFIATSSLWWKTFLVAAELPEVTSQPSDLQSRFQKLHKKYFESYTQIICKYLCVTFKIHCIMAQAFASREKFYENKVVNFSRLILTDSGVLLWFLTLNKL